ncbi:hypothetical protein PAEPH01_1620 [Pancytospora epiphaga]|nr:hypothetical protein PAEPH01_1620 [Pancytospora epiphaga]
MNIKQFKSVNNICYNIITSMNLLKVWIWLRLITAIANTVGVFDAGSTGTRLNIYKFENGDIANVESYRHQGGIHNERPTKVKDSIDYLLRESKIDPSIPLWFHGTAGMRSLSLGLQAAILTEVKKALSKHNLQDAKIISAGDEGQYMLKAFEHLSPHNKAFMILDMGGFSVQLIKKKENLLKVESYELGIMKGRCEYKNGVYKYLTAERTRNLPFQCPSAFKGTNLMNILFTVKDIQVVDFYCKQSQCIIENFIRNSLNGLGVKYNEYSIFLCSYLYDLFSPYGKVITFKEVKNRFEVKCKDASDECNKMHYAILFLGHLSIHDDEKLYPLQRIGGFDVTWALGRAVEAVNQASRVSQMNQASRPDQTGQGGLVSQTSQIGQPSQTSQIGQPSRISQIGQPSQTSQIGQPSRVSQMNQANQPDQTGQGGRASQTGQSSQMNQVSQPDQIGRGGRVSQTGQPSRVNQTGQSSQMNQVSQPDQIGQGGRVSQTGQPSQMNRVIQIGHPDQEGQVSRISQINRTMPVNSFEPRRYFKSWRRVNEVR